VRLLLDNVDLVNLTTAKLIRLPLQQLRRNLLSVRYEILHGISSPIQGVAHELPLYGGRIGVRGQHEVRERGHLGSPWDAEVLLVG